MFKSDIDDLKVISMSSDSIYKKKGCEYNNVWTQYVDLRYEREHAADTLINRCFVLHTPYTKDLELTVPGKDKQLSQAIYEYKVRMIDYFPLRVACEVDVVRLRDYFGLRMSAGKRWGGYLSFKFSGQKREGFNADEIDKEVDVSKKTYLGRIRNSYMAGIKYGIISRDYPLYTYLGFGYGDDGSQRSNGKRGKNVYPIIITIPMDLKERWEPIGCFLIFFRFLWGQMSYLVIVSLLISIAP